MCLCLCCLEVHGFPVLPVSTLGSWWKTAFIFEISKLKLTLSPICTLSYKPMLHGRFTAAYSISVEFFVVYCYNEWITFVLLPALNFFVLKFHSPNVERVIFIVDWFSYITRAFDWNSTVKFWWTAIKQMSLRLFKKCL